MKTIAASTTTTLRVKTKLKDGMFSGSSGSSKVASHTTSMLMYSFDYIIFYLSDFSSSGRFSLTLPLSCLTWVAYRRDIYNCYQFIGRIHDITIQSHDTTRSPGEIPDCVLKIKPRIHLADRRWAGKNVEQHASLRKDMQEQTDKLTNLTSHVCK